MLGACGWGPQLRAAELRPRPGRSTPSCRPGTSKDGIGERVKSCGIVVGLEIFWKCFKVGHGIWARFCFMILSVELSVGLGVPRAQV